MQSASTKEWKMALDIGRTYIDGHVAATGKRPHRVTFPIELEKGLLHVGIRWPASEIHTLSQVLLDTYELTQKPKPVEIPMNTMPFFRGISVVGQHFLNDDSKAALKLISPGDIVTLQHEPTNPHDQYAVGVYFGGQRVGYIFKECSPAVAWLLCIKMPLKVQVTEIGGKANNFKVNIIEDKPVTP